MQSFTSEVYTVHRIIPFAMTEYRASLKKVYRFVKGFISREDQEKSTLLEEWSIGMYRLTYTNETFTFICVACSNPMECVKFKIILMRHYAQMCRLL